MARPSTPPRRNPDGSTTIRTHRCCNGCGTDIGDTTDAEMAAAVAGRPLPDVRPECPACTPETGDRHVAVPTRGPRPGRIALGRSLADLLDQAQPGAALARALREGA